MGDKKENLKRYLRLYKLYFQMDFRWLFRNFKISFIFILAEIIVCISSTVGVFLLGVKFGNIGGLSKYEVLFMLAYNTILNGLFSVFFSGNNVGHISRIIGRGQLEHMLIQPLSLKAQILTAGFMPVSGGGNLISGLMLLSISLLNLELAFSHLWFLKLGGSLIITTIFLLGLSYLASSFAFYAPVAGEEISYYVLNMTEQISSFPLNGMPKLVKTALITILPTGLMAWLPSMILLEKIPKGIGNFYPLFALIIVLALANVFFRKGMSHYVKYGINRYSATGHR